MAFTILDSTGPIVSVKIGGDLSRAEVAEIQAAALKAIQQCGKIRALFTLEDFRGWKRDGNWGDVSFMTQHDQNITKIAVVGEEQWRDSVYAFLAKGFRSAAIEYFLPAELTKARAWLEANKSK